MTIALLAMSFACAAPPVDFDSQVMPVLTKSGCNAGACHGAAAGRGGLHLSLFGADPAGDHDSLVHEFEGRRINLADAQKSLLLLKPTAELKHGGGLRLDADGAGAKIIADWIADGASRSKQPKRLTQFQIRPVDAAVAKVGDSVLLRAFAKFDDGQEVDVTDWTVFAPADPASLAVDDSNVTVRRLGQHVVIARFLNRVAPVRLSLPFGAHQIDHSREVRADFIDDEVLNTLSTLRLPVSPSASDATFLRRLRLDLTGRLPNEVELDGFEKDSRPDKRARIVDQLLAGDDFVEYWTYRLAAMLRNRVLPNEQQGTQALHNWLGSQLRRRTPYDRMARELLTGQGDSHTNGPAWFMRIGGEPGGQAEQMGRTFLGVRIQCANCHNHPLDRWTQDDYHGLAAVFAKLERGRIVKVGSRGSVTHPRTGEPALPAFAGVNIPAHCVDARQPLADWITNPENPLFAKAIVNRLWSAMFGRGLVEPVDDLRDTNPATHPALLDRLAKDCVEHQYDIRHTLRLIAMSDAYARNATILADNRADDRYYSRSMERPLFAEVLADAIDDVTGVTDRDGEKTPAKRAIAMVDPAAPSRALDALGRCARSEPCESPTLGGGLASTLFRLNGEFINRKIAAPNGRLHQMIASGKSNEEILTTFSRLAFARTPTPDEKRMWTVPKNADRIAWLEDAVWAILNSREFMTNH